MMKHKLLATGLIVSALWVLGITIAGQPGDQDRTEFLQQLTKEYQRLVQQLTGTKDTAAQKPIYGFGVKVVPDEEFDDFVRCGMSIFTLEDEEGVVEPPSLWIMAGDSNGMVFRGLDGMDVRLDASRCPWTLVWRSLLPSMNCILLFHAA